MNQKHVWTVINNSNIYLIFNNVTPIINGSDVSFTTEIGNYTNLISYHDSINNVYTFSGISGAQDNGWVDFGVKKFKWILFEIIIASGMIRFNDFKIKNLDVSPITSDTALFNNILNLNSIIATSPISGSNLVGAALFNNGNTDDSTDYVTNQELELNVVAKNYNILSINKGKCRIIFTN